MKFAADLFGKDVPDAPSETVILSWTASLVWHVEVSMFYYCQLAKCPIAGVDKL